jgi:hypothetical protein
MVREISAMIIEFTNNPTTRTGEIDRIVLAT